MTLKTFIKKRSQMSFLESKLQLMKFSTSQNIVGLKIKRLSEKGLFSLKRSFILSKKLTIWKRAILRSKKGYHFSKSSLRSFGKKITT